MANTPGIVGKSVVITLFLDGQKQPPVDVISSDYEEVGDEIADGYLGEDRDTYSFELRGYKVMVNARPRTLALLKNTLIKYNESRDNSSTQDIALAVSIRDKTGLKDILKFTEG